MPRAALPIILPTMSPEVWRSSGSMSEPCPYWRWTGYRERRGKCYTLGLGACRTRRVRRGAGGPLGWTRCPVGPPVGLRRECQSDRRARDGRPHNSLLRARRVDRLIFRSQDRNFWIPGRSGWSDFADSTSQSVGHRLFLSEAGADVMVTTIAFLAFNAGAIS